MQIRSNLFLFSFSLITLCSLAQDTHFWDQQYGSRSAMLGGAVVGGVRDNSAIFYNPGALAMVDSATIAVSGKGYQYDMLEMKNGAGTNINMSSNQFQGRVPLMASDMYRFKKHPKHVIGYSVLTHNSTGINLTARNSGLLGVIPQYNNPGKEDYVGQYNYKSSLNEIWAGLTYAYSLSSHISFGITNFAAYRVQSMEQSYVARVNPLIGQLYSDSGITLLNSSDIQTIQFSNIRAFSKIGMAMDFNKLKIGIALTTSSINLGGTAAIARDFTSSNVNSSGTNIATYFTQTGGMYEGITKNSAYDGNDGQNTVKTTYKSPLSISGGVEYTIGKTTLTASVEWFQQIAIYNMATPAQNQFIHPLNSSGSSAITSDTVMGIREGSKSVTNLAFGIQHPITEKISLLASFRTDYSSYLIDTSAIARFGGGYVLKGQIFNRMNLSYTNWDLYHVTIGAMLKKEKSDFTLGLSYAWSNKKEAQRVNLSDPVESNYLFGVLQPAQVVYNSFALLMGYIYHIR